jgi:hypothetical protein
MGDFMEFWLNFLNFVIVVLYGLMFFKLLNVLGEKNILNDDDIHCVSSFSFEHKQYLKKKYKK